MRTRTHTDEGIIEAVRTCKSAAASLRMIGLIPAGGNHGTLRDAIKRLNLDTSHWTGQLWSKGVQLKNLSDYTNAARCKPHLIKERGHTCECCKNSTWMEKLIPLEIHHIDGNKKNNAGENLLLLCCNCHAQTDTWRRKKH